MVQNCHESTRNYWATCLSIHSFARTVHSFAYSASLMRSAAFIRLLARSLTHSQARGKVNVSLYNSALSFTNHFLIQVRPLVRQPSFCHANKHHIRVLCRRKSKQLTRLEMGGKKHQLKRREGKRLEISQMSGAIFSHLSSFCFYLFSFPRFLPF